MERNENVAITWFSQLIATPSPKDIEDEKFEREFSFYVASPESFDKIRERSSRNIFPKLKMPLEKNRLIFHHALTETESGRKERRKTGREQNRKYRLNQRKRRKRKKAPAKKTV